MKTLREKCIRAMTEGLLKKMGVPTTLLDVKEEPEKIVQPMVSVKDAERVMEKGDAFFARFGLKESEQEELFKTPLVQAALEEIITGVHSERHELERTIGKPRGGWKPLPFETEAIELPKEVAKVPEIKKEKEIRTSALPDQSAQQQIAAIQKRLQEALVQVKKAAENTKVMLPTLPKAPQVIKMPSLQVQVASKLPLPDFSENEEKREISIDVGQHYEKQFKVVVEENPLQQAVDALLGKSADKQSVAKGNTEIKSENKHSTEAFLEQTTPEKTITNHNVTPVTLETGRPKSVMASSDICPPSESIKDTEQVTLKEGQSDTSPVVIPEVLQEQPVIRRRSFARSGGGVVIATLRSRRFQEQPPPTSVFDQTLLKKEFITPFGTSDPTEEEQQEELEGRKEPSTIEQSSETAPVSRMRYRRLSI